MIEKNIEKLLDILKNSKDNLIQAEYIFDELRKYIEDKKDIYKKILEKYDQKELNKIVQLSYKEYVKRAQKIFLKEVIGFVIFMILVTVLSAFGFRVSINMLLLILISVGIVYCIIRSFSFKKQLERKTKQLINEKVDKNIIEFVKGLNNE